MNELKISVSFDAEALDVLNRIAAGLACVGAARAVPAPVDAGVKTEEVPSSMPAQAAASPAAEAVPSETAAPAPVKWSLGEIRKRVMDLGRVNDDLKKAARALVNEYAPRVTEIPEEKYNEFMEKLEALYVKPAE